ncbi:MAG: phenol hydroxylase [Myxococcales bacterium]|nr:phenol hydroxylase [Myxococcales bacterium]
MSKLPQRGPQSVPGRRYVRVTARRKGLVEFEFSLGDPSVALEMILPEAAFSEFCREQQARFLPEKRDDVDRD